MTELSFDKTGWMQDREGVWLMLRVPNVREAQRVCEHYPDGKYSAELKERRKKRSMNANNYFWQLLDQIAAALGRVKEELYLEYIKRVGVFKDFTLSEEEAKTFRVAWSMLGVGWPTEQVDYSPSGREVIIRAYYGSSQYSTRQMSRLIDMAVEDAKDLGIEVLTPMELERMKEEWGKR
jgi:hypothetical protein